MLKQMLILVCSLCLVLLGMPEKVIAAPGVSAHSAALIEQSTGRVLYEKNAHEPQRIASITKIMTAIIAIESGKMEETVTVSRRAVYTEGSSIYLEEGEKIKLKDLVYGLMLRSGNDSAVAIAEHVAGSVEGFVFLMNEKAEWLGMNKSHFENPHGLDAEGHRSTAYDMALLMRHAMGNKTFKEITGTTSYLSEVRTYPWTNKNKLLTQYYKYCTGGKTGYTKKAGRTLVSTAEKDDMELIMVTINDPDDWQDHMRLFEWGFENYKMEEVQPKGIEHFSLQSSERQLKGVIQENVHLPLMESELVRQQTWILTPAEREKAYPVIGKKVFTIHGEYEAEVPIYIDETKSANQTMYLFKQLLGIL